MGNTKLSQTELFANRYELQEEIGSGGMGVIYQAKDRLTGKLVALKQLPQTTEFLLSTAFADDNLTSARVALIREFEILATLHHPHIIQVQDYGFWQGNPYFTMSLLENAQNIKSYAQNLNLTDKVELILQVLQSLAYLHQRGILHHDIKPSNILVNDGHVYLLDFGLSIEQGLQHLRRSGTVAYLAPEIVLHRASSVASDLYSLGVVFYELLTGKHPYQARRLSDLMEAIVTGTPDFNIISELEYGQLPYDKPEENIQYEEPEQFLHDDETRTLNYSDTEIKLADLDTLVFEHGQFLSPLAKVMKRLLAKQPEDRYADAQAVIDALNEALHRPAPSESEAIRESYLQFADFVGRTEEYTQLTDALLASFSGEGSFWLIGGESGVGKSRLVSEIERLAKVWGAVVLRGSSEQFNSLPYQYWREPLRRLLLTYDIDALDASILKPIVPDIEQLLQYPVDTLNALANNQEDQRLIFTIADLFSRINSPIVLILEDLHWAVESLKVLQAVVGEVSGLPLLILATYQPHIRPDLPEVLPHSQVIRLECFNDTEVSELTGAILGQNKRNTTIINFLTQETEGNAFFIVETLRALAEESGTLRQVANTPLPVSLTTSGIQSAIMARLMRYPAEFRALLVLAAVIGRQLDTHLLWHIVQAHPEYRQVYPHYTDIIAWLSKSANASILTLTNDTWQFTHDKLREVVLDALDETQKRELHEMIAQGYEAVYPDNDDYTATLYHHWQQAQNDEKEIHYALIAARQLTQISSHHEALRYAKDALAKLDEDDDMLHACFNDVMGRAYIELGFHQEAAEHFEISIALAQKIGDKRLETQSRTMLGWVYTELNKKDQAQSMLEYAIQLAEDLDDSELKADALVQYGLYWSANDQDDKIKAIANEAIAIYASTDNQAGLGRAYNLRAIYSYYKLDYAEAAVYFKKSLVSLERCGNRWMQSTIYNNLGALYRRIGDFQQAEENIQKAYNISQRLNSDWGIMSYYIAMTYIGIYRSHLATITTYLPNALEIALKLDNLTFITSIVRLAAHYFMLTKAYTDACQIVGLCMNYGELRKQARIDCAQILEDLGNLLDEETMANQLEVGASLDIKEFARNTMNDLRRM